MFLVSPRTWMVLRANAKRVIVASAASRISALLALAIVLAALPAAAAPRPSGFAGVDGDVAITISINPTSANLVSLETMQFTATVKNTTNTGVTWKKTGNGSISTSGLFTAPWVSSGTNTTTITVTSKADKTKSASATVKTAPIPALVITTAGLPDTTTGASYTHTLSATGGTPPYSWSVTLGALPTGIAMSSSGKITGSTTETGAFTFTARVQDSGKYPKNTHVSYTINVNLDRSGKKVPASFFNMHMDLTNTPWPSSPIAGQRLWDSGVNWALINTAKGVYDWSSLDEKFADAYAHSADVLYTLTATPGWAQCNLTTSSPCSQIPGCSNDTENWGGGPGQCYWPGDLNADGSGTNQHWKDWVTAVAKHSVASNTAHIRYYEVMNEPNVDEFWRGTTAQVVRMAKDAACIIKGIGSNCTNNPIDPNALILTPSPALGGDAINSWLTDFFSQGGAPYIDVIAFHGYNGSNAEKLPTLVSKIRDGAQSANGLLTKPLFDTEFSWGIHVDFPDPDMRAGFVAKTMMTHWSSGVSRVFWYGWDVSGIMWSPDSITGCTTPDSSGVGFSCKAGTALTQTETWLVGLTQTDSCAAEGTIWTCGYTKAGGYRALAVWDSSKTCSNGSCTTASYTFPPASPNYIHYRDLSGKTHTISGKTVPVGYKPIWLENQ